MRTNRKSRVIILATLAAICLGGGWIPSRVTPFSHAGGGGHLAGEAVGSDSEGRPGRGRKPAAGPTLGDDEKVEAATLTLRPAGFNIPELTLSGGKVLLALNKRVGPLGVAFELRADLSGAVVWRAEMPEKVLDYAEVINLRPGAYTLTADGSPDWVCRITATPPGRR